MAAARYSNRLADSAGTAPCIIDENQWVVPAALRERLVDLTEHARAFEYVLGVNTVIIGLAVTDVATSFHRLARRRDKVRWDPLTVLAALYAIWMCVSIWFTQWKIRDVAETRQFFFYLTMFAEFFLLYLIAAASLPDEPEDDCDLRAYYKTNQRYFWSLVVLFELFYVGHGVYFYTHGIGYDVSHILMGFVVPLVVPVVLLFTRSRTTHYLGLAALFIVTGIDRASFTIN